MVQRVAADDAAAGVAIHFFIEETKLIEIQIIYSIENIEFTFFATYGNCSESSLVSLLVSSIIARRSCNVPVLLPLCTVNVLCGKISMPGTTVRLRPLGRLCFQHVNIMHTNNNANNIPPNAIKPTSNTKREQTNNFKIRSSPQIQRKCLPFKLI